MFSGRVWTWGLIGVISLCRIGMGIYQSIAGPTLLYLAENVDASITVISTVFTARSIGNLVGAVIGGIIKRYVGPNFRHLLTLGAGVGILGLMDLVVPWIASFWLLICDIIIGGMMYGYLDAGLQALLLQLWGEKASRPHVQLFHFMFSVGAFIAPLIAGPFLVRANEDTSADENCPNQDDDEDMFSTTYSPINETGTVPPGANFNPIGWTYIIAGLWLIFVSVLMMALSLCTVEKKVSMSMEEKGYSSEKREEEPLRDLIWLFLIIIAYYFFSVTTENVFYNFIYSIALCSDLHFSVTQASALNSVFWLGLGLGRLSGVVASNFFKPGTIIMFCIGGAIIDMTLMTIWGENTPWVAWTVSGLHGYTTAMLYPCGVSWISQFTNISGTYMFIFNIGNALGSLTMLPLAGFLFDIDPFSVVYLCLVLAVADALVFTVGLYVGKKHTIFLQTKSERKTNDRETISIVEEESIKHYDNAAFEATKL